MHNTGLYSKNTLKAVNDKVSWSLRCIRCKTANIKVFIVFSSPTPPTPMTVVKQSPFSLVPKLGYIRNYAVSMTCFTLLLVCPEVSYPSKHNHFSSTAPEQEHVGVHWEYCLFISVSDIQLSFSFLALFFLKHENQAESYVCCTVAYTMCF